MKLVFTSDEVVWIPWKYGAEEDVPNLRHTNEVIGNYVTKGRKNPYVSLSSPAAIERDLLWHGLCDIHSAESPTPTDWNWGQIGGHDLRVVPLRNHFGICEWCAKTYAYRELTWESREQTVCKVRGINLNYNSSKMVNFEVIRDMMLRWKLVLTHRCECTYRKQD